MSNQFTSIVLRGVERHKSPTLADDGGASLCHNLRPAVSGLEIVKNKPLLYRIGAKSSFFRKGVEAANDGLRTPEITTVYRHRALPKGYYLIVLNKREVTLWKETADDARELEQVAGEKGHRHNGGYPARYDEDIVAIGELNNVLVVRTKTRQDYFLWNDGAYSYMPALAAPERMVLTQDYDFEGSGEGERAKKRGRAFFQAIIGFKMTPGKNFLTKYRESLKSCLQFIQGLRAEDEAENRKAGRFVGHVLVRTAFKTAQGNYVGYGQVLHAEIGSWYGNFRKSNFYTSDDAEKLAGVPWYKKIHAKMIDDDLGGADMLLPDGGNGGAGFYPIAMFEDSANKGATPEFTLSIKPGTLACNCGHSQPPVLVGTFPKNVWTDIMFRGGGADVSDEGKKDDGDAKYFFAGLIQDDSKPEGKNTNTMPVGVYAPSVFYSYPILKVFVSKSSGDGLNVKTLKYYAENNIVQSLCVAMTAPVKHGSGTELYKNGTIKKNGWFEFEDETKDGFGGVENIEDEYKGKTDADLFDVYGYPTNIDVEPDKLLSKNFYVVKDIPIQNILDDINNGNVTAKDGGYWYSIPLQLKDIGVVENLTDGGVIDASVNGEKVAFSQEEMADMNYVSLNNIELAKPLPTDNFTAHRVMGKQFFDYNRRLHLFDTDIILFDGNSPSPALSYDHNGFGGNAVVETARELYMEYEIETDKRTFLKRARITKYICQKDGNGDNKEHQMILNDVLTYPDYRCKKMRVVERKEDGWYGFIGAEFECRNSVLNNLAYYAETSKTPATLPSIQFSKTAGGFRAVRKIIKKKPFTNNITVGAGKRTRCVAEMGNLYSPDGSGKPWPDVAHALHAYREDDTFMYRTIVVNLNLSKKLERDDDAVEDALFSEGNRVQVSETDDVFSFPLKNSYRVGTQDNAFVAVNSMYGQVTEQKFGMFPLYMFTKEGIFTLEQGTGDILYQNVSKINDDCLTSPQSLCNAGDMIAYVVKNGLKLIQGKSAMLVSELVRGKPYPIADVEGLTSEADFVDEIQGGYLLWDEYHNDVLMLCPRGGVAEKDVAHIMWAYNTLAKTFNGRGDANNAVEDGERNTRNVGVVENAKNLAWGGDIERGTGGFVPPVATFAAGGIVVGPGIGGQLPVDPGVELEPDLGDEEETDTGTEVQAAPHRMFLNVWDYNKADELTEDDTTLRFAYVSNLYKLGMNGYKHMERLVLRAFGNVGSLKITLYGSLDGRRCFKIGESKDISRVDDATLRRSPCSFVYFGFSIIGDAIKGSDVPVDEIILQIAQIDMELRQKYAGKLR